MSSYFYMPVLKWRMGEYSALRELFPQDKKQIFPLCELSPIPWDFGNDVPAKTLDEHVGPVPDQVLKNWGSSQPICFDLSWLEPADRMASGAHPLTWLFDGFRTRNVQAIPVTGPEYDAAYTAAAAAIVKQDGRGVCVRLLDRLLAALLSTLNVEPGAVHLVLDLDGIASGQEYRTAVAVIAGLQNLPSATSWRSVTLASSAFPPNLGDLNQGMHTLPRSDLTTWRNVHKQQYSIPILPNYGDYAISAPEPTDIDPRIMKMSANLRYTLESDWLILKARNVRDYGFAQYRVLCAALVADKRYCGSSFSAGDEYIAGCAAEALPTGNATVWRRIGTNHHLTFVVRQLATLLDSSASSEPGL